MPFSLMKFQCILNLNNAEDNIIETQIIYVDENIYIKKNVMLGFITDSEFLAILW